MKKVALDNLNTVDSYEWHHKGYVIKAWREMNGYDIFTPANPSKASDEAHTLAEAKEWIEDDIAMRRTWSSDA